MYNGKNVGLASGYLPVPAPACTYIKSVMYRRYVQIYFVLDFPFATNTLYRLCIYM